MRSASTRMAFGLKCAHILWTYIYFQFLLYYFHCILHIWDTNYFIIFFLWLFTNNCDLQLNSTLPSNKFFNWLFLIELKVTFQVFVRRSAVAARECVAPSAGGKQKSAGHSCVFILVCTHTEFLRVYVWCCIDLYVCELLIYIYHTAGRSNCVHILTRHIHMYIVHYCFIHGKFHA